MGIKLQYGKVLKNSCNSPECSYAHSVVAANDYREALFSQESLNQLRMAFQIIG